jgi:TRAP-type C4-dicarboxylate transport system permease small subunit
MRRRPAISGPNSVLRDPDILKQAAWPFGLAAASFLTFMMLFTTIAVVLRQVFDTPVLGVVDLMELALVGMVFLAIPGVFLRDENVTVDVIDQFVSRRTRLILRLSGLAVTLAFLILMMIQMIPLAMDKWEFSEVTMTLGIDRFIHWIPIIFGFAMSVAATAWVTLYYIRHGDPVDPTIHQETFE